MTPVTCVSRRLSIEIVRVTSMQSARSCAFSALTHMPGLVSIEPVYLLDIGLAAIAARSPFGTKAGAGIILPLPLMIVMTGMGVGAGGGANVEAIGAGGSTAIAISAMWLCWHFLAASRHSFTFFPAQDHPFFSLLRSPEPLPEVAGCSFLDFPFQDSG